jgi:hypothetical protein
MSDHPSTYEGTPTGTGSISWDDRAALHRRDDADGVLDGARALRKGSFAELVAHVMMMDPDERKQYEIEKLGDREYSAAEIAELAKRPDFPGHGNG